MRTEEQIKKLEISQLTQQERVLKVLMKNRDWLAEANKQGAQQVIGGEMLAGLNPLEAWKDLGIYRLAVVICNLRKRGYDIVTEDYHVTNRFGEGVMVASYRLI